MSIGMIVNLAIVIASTIYAFFWCIDCVVSDVSVDDELRVKDIIGAISFFTCIISTVLLIVCAIMLGEQDWEVSDEPYRTDYIASMNDGTQINGRLYLRHGYIEENMYYQYMIKCSDGGYSYGKAREDIATIYISDGNYRAEWYKEKRHWLWFSEERNICRIYVPDGCIKEEYNIDLE